VADGTGLAGRAAALDGDREVQPVHHVGDLQRLADDHARGLAAEELVDRAVVDRDEPAAELHEDRAVAVLRRPVP